MSYHVLQHVVVRMLFDPKFVKAVYAQPEEALAGLALTSREHAQILAIDQRAWGYDSLRQLRSLRTLVEEFKVSSTLALAETRQLAFLAEFFASPAFHQSVQQRGSMALGFAQFLADACQKGRLKTPQLPDILRLETLMARCRRELLGLPLDPSPLPERLNENMRVKLAPGVGVGAFQAQTIATIQQVEKYLFEVGLMPAMVLCDDAPRLGALPVVEPKQKIYLMCSPVATASLSLIAIERADYLVLLEARATLPIKQVLDRAVSAGINRTKAQEIIAIALDQRQLYLTNSPLLEKRN